MHAESEIERLFREEAARVWPADPALIREYPVTAGGQNYRLDFAVPGRMLGIELDGHATHSSPAAIASDRQRQRDLEDSGWRIRRYGGAEVMRDPAEAVADALRWAGLEPWRCPVCGCGVAACRALCHAYANRGQYVCPSGAYCPGNVPPCMLCGQPLSVCDVFGCNAPHSEAEAEQRYRTAQANGHVCTVCGGPSGSTGRYDMDAGNGWGEWVEMCETCMGCAPGTAARVVGDYITFPADATSDVWGAF